MIDKQKLKAELRHFTGSEQVFYNPMFPEFKYTEGVKYLAQEANCYWLLDYVFSNLAIKAISEQPFQVWKLKVAENRTATIIVEDGNGNQIKSFQLTFTDFPLEEIDLWFIEGVLILPSEY